MQFCAFFRDFFLPIPGHELLIQHAVSGKKHVPKMLRRRIAVNHTTNGTIQSLLSLPIFHAEWVLWLLIALSAASIAIIAERWVFYRKHSINIDEVRNHLSTHLKDGDFEGAAEYLKGFDSLETNVILFGLRDHQCGPDSVQELINGAEGKEQARFEKRLNFLATVASNAPFIGLFGTVLGIIRAFNDLSSNMSEASGAVMAGIAEALIATAVGLMVAIPAVIAFNVLKSKVKGFLNNLHLLSGILLASLKSDEIAGPANAAAHAQRS
jgi:biopolymer transport protein ExbB/TolQ